MHLVSIAAASVLALACHAATASPATARFTGTVDSVSPQPDLRADFSTGDRFDWQMDFDDAFAALPPDQAAAALDQPVSGFAQLGAYRFAIERLQLVELMVGDDLHYRVHLLGSGPATVHGGHLADLELTWDATLGTALGVRAHVDYPDGTGTLVADGNYRLEPASVPTPAPAWLLVPALGWMARRQAKRRPRVGA
ncbi:MAG: hypothetical protein U1F56_18715 [Rubrivivax sp.]